ncbi:MAG: hypothetical protein WBG73_17175 [Coleofasciculaceae cyanobacterium]
MIHHKIIGLTAIGLLLCQLPSMAQVDRYLSLGIDQFSQKPVYLDKESIKKISPTTYQYTLASESEEPDTGKSGRFEEDIVVDCTELGSIVHLGSRLYDGEGRLLKSDNISRTQDISDSRFAPYFKGNQTICNQLPKS